MFEQSKVRDSVPQAGGVMRSAEDADENQERIESVFAELAEAKPANVSYLVLRLADDSFVHVSFHDHGEDEVDPISSTAAFSRSKTATPIDETVM